MSADGESSAEKRRRLAADIERQRGQLATAYRDIAKPILYTEYGLRGMGFLRQNPWILTIVPAASSTTTSVVGLIRNLQGFKSKPAPTGWFKRGERDAERKAERKAKGVAGHLATWGGRGWKLFKTYRRVRKYFP